MPLTFKVEIESWPLATPFVISRGAKTHATVVTVAISDGPHTGHGECVPYARYGEAPETTATAIRAVAAAWSANPAPPSTLRATLNDSLPPGAARNAIDCALWDLEAKASGTSIARLTGLPPPLEHGILTAYTLSLDTADAMAAKARTVRHLPLLKLKLGGEGDAERLRAIRAARPDARLIADANEAWTNDLLTPLMAVAAETSCEMIEQPLPAGHDTALACVPRIVPVCADESLHTRAELASLADRYDAVNIKLDKTGGLTEAIALATQARALGLEIMIGSMVATSLAIAPALALAPLARWVDLDGPLLLANDRPAGLAIHNGQIAPATPNLWG
ncbi:MAG: dipeptide epimerase [Hyphomicrobiaceae bacterium]|nr:dipeptide epimerase [Hyphomicrobiaceae bacterium]